MFRNFRLVVRRRPHSGAVQEKILLASNNIAPGSSGVSPPQSGQPQALPTVLVRVAGGNHKGLPGSAVKPPGSRERPFGLSFLAPKPL